jgi:hypothetical protein
MDLGARNIRKSDQEPSYRKSYLPTFGYAARLNTSDLTSASLLTQGGGIDNGDLARVFWINVKRLNGDDSDSAPASPIDGFPVPTRPPGNNVTGMQQHTFPSIVSGLYERSLPSGKGRSATRRLPCI